MKKKILKLATAFLFLILSACAATTKVINGPDGTPHQLVTCGQTERCYEKATEVCGGPYQIINTSNEVSGDIKFTSSITKLLVKCKN